MVRKNVEEYFFFKLEATDKIESRKTLVSALSLLSVDQEECKRRAITLFCQVIVVGEQEC